MEETNSNSRFAPIDRREIRGITLESIIKYGGLIIAIAIAWGTIKTKLEALEIRVIELEKAGALRQQQIEVLKTNQGTNEVWKARIEEKISTIKNEHQTISKPRTF